MSRRAPRSAGIVVLLSITIVTAGGSQGNAAFPGANGRIVFDTARSFFEGTGRSQIYTVRANGSGLRRLTRLPKGVSAWQPRLSADGRSVVFVVSGDGQNDQLWLMRSDGTRQRPLTDEPDWSHSGASFTPGGNRIIYSRCGNYVIAYWTCHIVSVRRNGSGMRTIVGGRWHPSEAVVSPDGSIVAFVSDKGGYDARLWLMEADGSNRRTIGPTDGMERLSWAPDGSGIAFTGDFRDGVIRTISVDGGDLFEVMPGLFPAWSPSGRWLVYASESNDALERVWADGTHVETVLGPGDMAGIGFSDWGVAP